MIEVPKLKDAALTEKFRKDGYVIIRSAAVAEAESLRSFVADVNPSFNEDFYYSLLSNSPEENLKISKGINERLTGIYEQLFESCRVRNESFLAKPAGHLSEMYLHQDWIFTDPERFQSGTLWIPLCDVDESNGAMFLIPGSHSFFQNYISGNLHTARIPSEKIPKENLVTLSLKFGDILIFNPSVFHGSFSNDSAKESG